MTRAERKVNRMNIWSGIIFFGSLWGICEATLGFVLHQAFAPFTGMILFPIGFLMMRLAQHTAFRENNPEDTSNSRNRIPLYVACVAAAIKLTNLFVPGAMWLPIINPAISIVLEGLMVTLCIPSVAKDSRTIAGALGASFAWRFAYVILLMAEASFGLKIRLFNAGMNAIFMFLTKDALINGILVSGFAIAIKRSGLRSHRLNVHPVASAMGLMMAIVVTVWMN